LLPLLATEIIKPSPTAITIPIARPPRPNALDHARLPQRGDEPAKPESVRRHSD
jgi:hypothetical protein